MRPYKVVLIDDEPANIDIIMSNVKDEINGGGKHEISYTIISSKKCFQTIDKHVADIVMFDCNLSEGDFDDSSDKTAGLTLLKVFRQKNKRTKIIFYSGKFGPRNSGNLSTGELVDLINCFNIFKLIPRDEDEFINTIEEAIENIDPILISLDELITEYGDDGVFRVDGQVIKGQELLRELKKESQIGEAFRKKIDTAILHYFMRFGGKDE
jgi:CheY-like chemotaxis protein